MVVLVEATSNRITSSHVILVRDGARSTRLYDFIRSMAAGALGVMPQREVYRKAIRQLVWRYQGALGGLHLGKRPAGPTPLGCRLKLCDILLGPSCWAPAQVIWRFGYGDVDRLAVWGVRVIGADDNLPPVWSQPTRMNELLVLVGVIGAGSVGS